MPLFHPSQKQCCCSITVCLTSAVCERYLLSNCHSQTSVTVLLRGALLAMLDHYCSASWLLVNGQAIWKDLELPPFCIRETSFTRIRKAAFANAINFLMVWLFVFIVMLLKPQTFLTWLFFYSSKSKKPICTNWIHWTPKSLQNVFFRKRVFFKKLTTNCYELLHNHMVSSSIKMKTQYRGMVICCQAVCVWVAPIFSWNLSCSNPVIFFMLDFELHACPFFSYHK